MLNIPIEIYIFTLFFKMISDTKRYMKITKSISTGYKDVTAEHPSNSSFTKSMIS